MLIRSFEEADEIAGRVEPKKVSVVKADNREFLLALKEAHERGYAEPVLIGDEQKIREIAAEISFDITKFAVIDVRDPQESADKGVQLVESGETNFILRGYIDGPYLYRALIGAASKRGFRRCVSGVALMQFPVLPKLIAVTDAGLTVAPDFRDKMDIIEDAVDLFSRFGYESPQVGIIAARRGLNDELGSVSDAVRIREAFERGELAGCRLVEGLSLSDFLLGREGFLEGFEEIDYSRIPDIIIAPNLEYGNIFCKIDNIAANDFFSGIRRHVIIVGGGIPAVVPSRSDSHKTIISDIALGVLSS